MWMIRRETYSATNRRYAAAAAAAIQNEDPCLTYMQKNLLRKIRRKKRFVKCLFLCFLITIANEKWRVIVSRHARHGRTRWPT